MPRQPWPNSTITRTAPLTAPNSTPALNGRADLAALGVGQMDRLLLLKAPADLPALGADQMDRLLLLKAPADLPALGVGQMDRLLLLKAPADLPALGADQADRLLKVPTMAHRSDAYSRRIPMKKSP